MGATFDASHFYDYYESVAWKVGKKKMKDWRAAVRTWMRNDKRWQQQRLQPAVTQKTNFKKIKY